MLKVSLSEKAISVLPKIKRHCKENLGAPFVVGGQMLLLVYAGLFVVGNSALANKVAIFAYLLLLIGVVLQLFSFPRHKAGKAKPMIDEASSEMSTKEC